VLTLPLIIEKKFLHFLRAIAELSHLLWERFCQAFPQHRNWVNVLGVNFHKINTLPLASIQHIVAATAKQTTNPDIIPGSTIEGPEVPLKISLPKVPLKNAMTVLLSSVN
jgi:hypothetical protein